jgi:uncharacterized membrane protein
MESLFILAILILLIGPVLAIIALVKISNLASTLRNLKMELMLRDTSPVAAQSPVPAEVRENKVWKQTTAKAEEVASAPEEITAEKAVEEISAEPEVKTPREANNVEKNLASRWFVWAGGIAVALGGLLFVKYAHDAGLIPPIARVIVGLIFAGALVFAGEWTRKRHDSLANGYIPAALSAAGIVIAFGVLYAAYALYDILSPGVCFPMLVAVGLGALWLSRRQGPLIAALGLLGAYVAPMLVPSEHPSVIGFFAYLAVVLCASLYELRDRPWWWLGFAAIGGATAWSLMWMNGFGLNPLWPIGIFALLTGATATIIPRGQGILAEEMGSLADPEKMQPPMWIAIAGMASGALQLAFLVMQSQHAMLALMFFAIGMAAITAFGWWRNGMVAAPLLAGLASWVVLMSWPEVGFHEWAFDERGFWVTVPGLIQPPAFRNAMFIALLAFTALGLFGLLRKSEKRPWAALAAGSAFVFLFGAWGRAEFTLSETTWAITAVALTAALAWGINTIRNTIAEKPHAQSVEILTIGIALLLLFAADRLLDGIWLTIAVAVIAATIAYATRIIALPNIAAIAAAIATFSAARLFIGREFWGEPTNVPLGAHWVFYGYGVPAALFWWVSRQLNGETFARYRMAFEGLALGLAISLVSLELRVLIGGGITKEGMGLLELSAHALAWLGAAYGLAYRQQVFSSFISLWGARVLLAASSLAFLAALTVRNPVITGDALEGNALINSLWLAYLAPVALIALMARKLGGLGLAKWRSAFGAFALVLLITFVTLQVKRWFQTSSLDIEFFSQAESYTTSLAWIITGVLIFIAGLRMDRQTIRYGGLAFLVLALLKVFGLDLFELGGLWRIASLIGIGFTLIGVGWLYTRFIQKPKVGAVASVQRSK